MSEQYQVLNLAEVAQDLRVNIGHGFGSIGIDSEPNTHIEVRPPLTDDEHTSLLESADPDSDLSRQLLACLDSTEAGGWTRFTVDGKPGTRHMGLGLELAQGIMALRGIKAASVVGEIGRKVDRRLVIDRSLAEA